MHDGQCGDGVEQVLILSKVSVTVICSYDNEFLTLLASSTTSVWNRYSRGPTLMVYAVLF